MITEQIPELGLEECFPPKSVDLATDAGETSPEPNVGNEAAILGTETVDGMNDGSADTLENQHIIIILKYSTHKSLFFTVTNSSILAKNLYFSLP